ncbi:CATRA system-associated protein [Streptomyces sp. NPDC091371]|uniref:CATRA system-associated protein n=1 Tax=Streptomyces sp. NPDC091371 TaxID=3155303 RepID=UPI003435FDE3
MSDWSDAREDARFVLAALSRGSVAEAGAWAEAQTVLVELEQALDAEDPDGLRRAASRLEDCVAGERMRMVDGQDPRTPPPPALAERLDRLVDRIRTAGEQDTAGPAGPGRSTDDDAA